MQALRAHARGLSRLLGRAAAPAAGPRAATRGMAALAGVGSRQGRPSWGILPWATFAGTAGAIAFASSRPADAKAIPIEGIPGTTYERTFLMIKPDGVQRGLIHEIIRRWEQRGFTLVALKMLVPSKKLAEAHYEDLRARPFYPALVEYISSSGPVVAMVWQGKDVIRTSRQMIGKTDPLVSDPGTVRADLACFVGRNVIHGSDGVDGAEAEIPLWFREAEIMLVDSKANPWLYDDRA